MFNKIVYNQLLKIQFVNVLLIILLFGILFSYAQRATTLAYIGLTLFIELLFLIVILIKLLYDSYKLNSIKLSLINSILVNIYIIIGIVFIFGYFQEFFIVESLIVAFQIMLIPIIISIIVPFVPSITKKVKL